MIPFTHAYGQTTPPAPQTPDADQSTPAADPDEPQDGNAIVVTGIRSSLTRAAEVKRDAVQVVDSIVATDIGKLPDPTTAAALQRVPGIQVQTDRNNELSGVSIRGLTDINTTLNGREVFTTTGRGFDLKDVPAEALGRVDVFKSQTADLIEGGVAGAIDLKLNRPFDFTKPILAVNLRQNYAARLHKSSPQIGVLASARADTGIGEIGVLVNGSWSRADSQRGQLNMSDRRASSAAPLNGPAGFLIPQVINNMPNVGTVTRGEMNAAIQWQATPSLQVYADGLYTYFQTTAGFAGFNPQPFNNGTTITDIVGSTDCFQARVNANGTNPQIVNNADGTRSLQPYTVQSMCNIKSATLHNVIVNQNSSSDRLTQKNKMIAGGLKFDRGGTKATLDVGYQTSWSYDENVNAEVGQRVGTIYLNTDVDDGASITLDPSIPMSSANLSIRNAFNQNYTLATGSLFQARLDGEQEIGGFLRKIQAGIRYADREAVNRNVQQTNPTSGIGCNNVETGRPSCLVSSLGLSPDFIATIGNSLGINGGQAFVGVNPDFLLSESGRNQLRALFHLPLRAPDFDPTHQFDASERTVAGYVQASYQLGISGDVTLDGVIGVRGIKTDRTISTYTKNSAGAIVPVSATTSDFDLLPSATARLKLPDGFQLRFNYARTMRRPGFESLNPTQSLTYVGNIFLLNTASAGNPNLKSQKSDSFDATAEYYFRGGLLAVNGYYRTIRNRVVNSSTQTVIDGSNFLLTTPRNVGEATLRGVEASAQYFLDFLPGVLSGFGVQGAFTYADSEIGGNDPLAGYALQGVSKYNYTLGALYDKHGLSGRLIYTFRSKYYTGDNSGAVSLRPIDAARVNEVFIPTQLIYVRPAGRLDFSIGYDVNSAFHIDVGGTNITRTKTKQYLGQTYLNQLVYGDETTYSIGLRVRF
ncbi:TonB-dependent receptor [Sphingomonas sp. HITSZ_GF]|uniref:TonB-dependent receptor n=1 Tax=Sphingomonas sp. HITSZ_GF TaxID=3037247 RepID=UPI00240E0FAC|nr:TonB-dependent receptor [Sphingomonas sp. HITSZ_GF]MDG2532658.1 TonB-dependent receptor [Sphingomonas sp. HITSZ_GF]